MRYDHAYNNSRDYFGSEPTDILKEYIHLLDRSKPVLDIGAGQGRNTLYLARQGLTVDAIDPSQVAIDTISEISRREKLPVRCHGLGFEDFETKPGYFGGVLLFGIIQILTRGKIDLLMRKTNIWLASGGLAFITAFTVDDPSYERNASSYRRAGKNSFQADDGQVFTYLETDEILKLFKNFEVFFHEESLGPMHQHGSSRAHQHFNVKAVLRKI